MDEDDTTEVYTGVLVGLRTIKEAVLRRRWLWLACAALGLVIGTDLHLVVPTKVSAVTNLYITEPSSAGQNGMADDISLLETDKVANQAYHYMHLSATAPQPGSYGATALSDIILQIKAEAPTAAEAVSWDNALTEAFFKVRDAELESQTGLLVNVLQVQVNQINAAIARLNTAIQALSTGSGGASAANQISQLISERSGDASQVSSLQSQIQQDQIDQGLVIKGSKVIDPATAIATSKVKVFAMDGASGLIAGAALGLGIVILGSVFSERPRRRSQIAGLLGAPVELSVGKLPLPGLNRSGLRRAVRKPSPELKLVQRRLRGHISPSGPESLAVVSVAADVAAAVSLSTLAAKLSTEGWNVTVVDMANGRPLSKLFKVGASGGRPQQVRMDSWAVTVVIAPGDPGELEPLPPTGETDVVLVLSDLDPALGADHLVGWARSAVVMLTVGKASETAIQSTGQMLRLVGLPPASAILLGTGREDESVGAVGPPAVPGAGTGLLDGNGPDGVVTWPGMRVPPSPGHYARQP